MLSYNVQIIYVSNVLFFVSQKPFRLSVILIESAPCPIQSTSRYVCLFVYAVPPPAFLGNHQTSPDLDSSCIEWWSHRPSPAPRDVFVVGASMRTHQDNQWSSACRIFYKELHIVFIYEKINLPNRYNKYKTYIARLQKDR